MYLKQIQQQAITTKTKNNKPQTPYNNKGYVSFKKS